MFTDHPQNLPGPDFLEQVAEAELHAGNLVNRDEWLRRARQWREEQREAAVAAEQRDAARRELEALKQRLAAAREQLAGAP